MSVNITVTDGPLTSFVIIHYIVEETVCGRTDVRTDIRYDTLTCAQKLTIWPSIMVPAERPTAQCSRQLRSSSLALTK